MRIGDWGILKWKTIISTFTINKCDKYKGNFQNDKKEGERKIIFKIGEEFEGIWKNDEISESNKMKNSNEAFGYEGGLKNGKYNGEGKYIDKNGSVYDGYWKDNKKEGEGKYKYYIDDEFKGKFKNDKEY